MTLEELKAAWDAALTNLKADPKNADLKTAAQAAEKAYNDAKAAEDAKGEGDDEEDEGEGNDADESKWDPKTKSYIQKLRNEAGKHRTKNKELVSAVKSEKERVKAILKAAGIEDESEAPEEKVKTLTTESQTLAFRNAVLESAVQHGIPGDDLEYYEFLVTKATSELEDGEELSDEALEAIVAKVKKTGGKGSANTSVGGKKGKDGKEAPKPGESNEVSLDEFCRMSITEKSKLWEKHPDTYQQLMTQARAKKRLV